MFVADKNICAISVQRILFSNKKEQITERRSSVDDS